MNYQRIYDAICNRAKDCLHERSNHKKNKQRYYEGHHIIPKCLGGTGKTYEYKWHDNIVLLTAKEHFICHRLLCLIYPDNTKLKYALWAMVNMKNNKQGNRHVVSGRVYDKIKNDLYETVWKYRVPTNKGISPSAASIEKNRISHLGKKLSIETISKRTETRKLRKSLDPDYSKKIYFRDKSTYKKIDPETLRKLHESNKGKKQKLKKMATCPYCNTTARPCVIVRWHLDNCKHKKDECI